MDEKKCEIKAHVSLNVDSLLLDNFDGYIVEDEIESKIIYYYLKVNKMATIREIAEYYNYSLSLISERKKILVDMCVLNENDGSYFLGCDIRDRIHPYDTEIENELEFDILQLIKSDPKIKQKAIAKTLHYDESTITRKIESLKRQKYCEKENDIWELLVRPVPSTKKDVQKLNFTDCCFSPGNLSYDDISTHEKYVNYVRKIERRLNIRLKKLTESNSEILSKIPLYILEYPIGEETGDGIMDSMIDIRCIKNDDEFINLEKHGEIVNYFNEARKAYKDAFDERERYKKEKTKGKHSESKNWLAIQNIVKRMLECDDNIDRSSAIVFDIYKKLIDVYKGLSEYDDSEVVGLIEGSAIIDLQEIFKDSEGNNYGIKRLSYNDKLWDAAFYALFFIFIEGLETGSLAGIPVKIIKK